MSGVRGRCFVRVAQGCTGLIGGGDLICGNGYQGADPDAWETGKERYNLAAVVEEGDQLICERKGCYHYIPKKKKWDLCRNCTRGHIGGQTWLRCRSTLPVVDLANSSRSRSRSPCRRLGLPEFQQSPTTLHRSAEEARLTAERISRVTVDAEASNARIVPTQQLLATYAETMNQLHATFNQFTADLAEIRRTQLSIEVNIRQFLDELDD